MGTLGGFPYPPVMVRGERSSPAPHATPTAALRASMMDSIVAWHPGLADEARSGSLRPLGVTPAARRTRRACFCSEPAASVHGYWSSRPDRRGFLAVVQESGSLWAAWSVDRATIGELALDSSSQFMGMGRFP
jgi:hypothetical protein